MKIETWYERIIRMATPAEETAVSIENEPKWVENVIQELTQQSMPALPFRNLSQFTPGDLGRLIGQQRANFEGVKSSESPTTEAFQYLLADYERIAHAALIAAWEEASQEERAAFFQGLAEGLSKPGILEGAPARATTATEIYQILFLSCEDVKQLKSVRELREFLLKSGLTEQTLGEPKRLEKLCQRIGLSFGEPGRPKRTK